MILNWRDPGIDWQAAGLSWNRR